MPRSAILCGLLLAVFCRDADAGLRSALSTSLQGLQPAETRIRGQGEQSLGFEPKEIVPLVIDFDLQFLPFAFLDVRKPALLLPFDPAESAPGFAFVDPIRSTDREAVFRSGPEFSYNALTNGISVFAPPIISPADVFGRRETYSATQVAIYAEGLLAGLSPQINAVQYRPLTSDDVEAAINSDTLDDLLGEERVFPSFFPDPTSMSSVASEALVSAQVANTERFSGLQVDFEQLLKPQINTAEVFRLEPRLQPSDATRFHSLFSLFPAGTQVLADRVFDLPPEVTVLVSYESDDTIRDEQDFRLIARPVIVPEPRGVLAVLLTLFAASLPRRFAPRVA